MTALSSIETHSVYTRLIDKGSNVIDLGANLGAFSHAMINQFGCHCYAVEPSPLVNQKIPKHDLLKLYEVAIAKDNGFKDFYLSTNSQASALTENPGFDYKKKVQVKALRLEEFISQLNLKIVDLLKMDIEGAEIEVLNSCPDKLLKKIGQISIEFHDVQKITPKSEIQKSIKKLESLGFLSVSNYRHTYSDVLFINKMLYKISVFEVFWIKYVLLPWIRIKRRTKHLLKRVFR